MVFIWLIGRTLEPAIGTRALRRALPDRAGGGSFGVLLLEPNAITVGASGAAFGLLGGLIVEARSRGIDLWSTGLLQLALINFAFTFALPGIAIGAHVFGFASGVLVGVLFVEADRRRLPRAVSLAVCLALGVAAFLGGIAVAGPG